MRKKLLIPLLIALSMLLAACGPAAGSAASPTPSVSVVAMLGPYTIEDSAIFNGLHKVVYDAGLYYGENHSAWVSGLTEEGSALYFIEGSAKTSGVSCGCDVALEDTVSAIVKIDGEGGNRQVLLAVPSGGLFSLQPYAGQIFFAESSETDVAIGYISPSGGEPEWLVLPDVDGAYRYDAYFDTDGEDLVVTIRYYNEATTVSTDLAYRIDDALTVTPEG